MTRREDKEIAKISREELGKFFYSLAKMTFGAMVLTSGVALVTSEGAPVSYLELLLVGSFTTAFFAGVGDKILKNKITIWKV